MTGIFDFGAGDLLELKAPAKRPLLIPFSEAAVLEIDLEEGRILVDPIAAVSSTMATMARRKGPGSRKRSPSKGNDKAAETRRRDLPRHHPHALSEMFPGFLGQSLSGKAWSAARGRSSQCRSAILPPTSTARSMTRHRARAGMVLRADILAKAIDSVGDDDRPRLLMSPRGKPLTQARVRELAEGPGAVIVCGRFEGRRPARDRCAKSRGNLDRDYILSGGEPAAMILLDAIVRVLPGVMGNEQSGVHESFESGLLEHPHYTRPPVFEGREIPEVLTSGNHAKIEKWRHEQALKLTAERRPDLLQALKK